jgi:hypothetical protein
LLPWSVAHAAGESSINIPLINAALRIHFAAVSGLLSVPWGYRIESS